MIETIFFDVGGVLKKPAPNVVYDNLVSNGRKIPAKRFLELLHDERALTGSMGTLDSLLHADYKDLEVTSGEIIEMFKTSPLYDETWTIARQLKRKGYVVGIISDQIAEFADILKKTAGFYATFYPVLISTELHLTKRTKEIFYKAEDLSGCAANKILMIDDNENVLEVARKLEFNCILFKDHKTLEEDLREYGLL